MGRGSGCGFSSCSVQAYAKWYQTKDGTHEISPDFRVLSGRGRWSGQALPYSHIAETVSPDSAPRFSGQVGPSGLANDWNDFPSCQHTAHPCLLPGDKPDWRTASFTTEDTKIHGACTKALCRTMILRAFSVDLGVLRGENRGVSDRRDAERCLYRGNPPP